MRSPVAHVASGCRWKCNFEECANVIFDGALLNLRLVRNFTIRFSHMRPARDLAFTVRKRDFLALRQTRFRECRSEFILCYH